MGSMSQSGVSVRMMSHDHERSESEWSRCEEKRKESVQIVTSSRSKCWESPVSSQVQWNNQAWIRSKYVKQKQVLGKPSKSSGKP